jgi:hypothetical protein
VLVLDVLPFWSDAFLEEMVVGFESEFRDGCDVVLGRMLVLRQYIGAVKWHT